MGADGFAQLCRSCGLSELCTDIVCQPLFRRGCRPDRCAHRQHHQLWLRGDRNSAVCLDLSCRCADAAAACRIFLSDRAYFSSQSSQPYVVDPRLAPPDHLSSVVALTALNFNLSRLIGPAVGGALINILGAAHSLMLTALCYGVPVAALWFMQPRDRARDTAPPRTTILVPCWPAGPMHCGCRLSGLR